MNQQTISKRPQVNYSRSKEILNAAMSKLQDITRYNSYKNNVYFYKSSPNRGDTPIKVPKTPKTGQEFYKPKKTNQELFLLNIARSFENIPTETKKKFILQGTKSQIRLGTTLPSMTEHRERKNPFILNDFHIRETNPGFARNDYGGFFTH